MHPFICRICGNQDKTKMYCEQRVISWHRFDSAGNPCIDTEWPHLVSDPKYHCDKCCEEKCTNEHCSCIVQWDGKCNS